MTIDYSIKVTQCEPMPGYKLKVTCSDGAGPSRFPAPSVQTHRRFHDGRLA